MGDNRVFFKRKCYKIYLGKGLKYISTYSIKIRNV